MIKIISKSMTDYVITFLLKLYNMNDQFYFKKSQIMFRLTLYKNLSLL